MYGSDLPSFSNLSLPLPHLFSPPLHVGGRDKVERETRSRPFILDWMVQNSSVGMPPNTLV